MGRQESQEYKERLKEMTGVLRKHNITKRSIPGEVTSDFGRFRDRRLSN